MNAQEENMRYFKDLPEAPVSVNFYMVLATGLNVQVTLRDWDEQNLIERLNSLATVLENDGAVAKPVGQQPRTDTTNIDEIPTDGDEDRPHFTSSALVAEVKEGKIYWKLKGTNFIGCKSTKYNVNVWPEVLKAAGVVVDKLDALKTYKFPATVYVEVNEKGFPGKAIEIVKEES